ncbi:MAG: ABC transporter ATP-binding protein [Betaproteobacteria bacterium]
MTQAAIAIADVRKTFPGSVQAALDGVTLEIRQNEFFTLLGPSGCGKTTLLRMIAGFENPDSGSIALDGVDMGRTPPNRRPVNTVFQSYALFPHMSVVQNIAFALEMLGRPRDAIRARVAEMIRLLRLEGLGERRPAQLSGGQQQRVALGRALAPEPKVLLLDEPLSALDLKLRKEMQVELKRLQLATGITFVFVTHDQEEALRMSDRIAVMRDGALMQVGRSADIYERPASIFVAEFIGDANFLPAVCVQRDGQGGRFRLSCCGDGAVDLDLDDAGGVAAGAKATLVLRPERISLVPLESALLRGEVPESIYSGSDLMLHARLADGTLLRVRLSGALDARSLTGGSAGFAFPREAVRAFAA